jgi:GTP cyclohydrolase IA
MNRPTCEEMIRALLYAIEGSSPCDNDKPLREGLLKTPQRVVESWKEIYGGYKMDPKEILTSAQFNEGHKQMVIQRDIPFYSTCEHHMIPFFGTADVGYIPGENGKVVGISKLARIVDCFAKRLQIQERLTSEIVSSLQEHLQPLGAMCVIRAEHLCMCARGVKKPGSQTITSALTGVFQKDYDPRMEFLHLTDTQR